MDSDDLTKTLKLAKKQLEENNKLFIKSLDKKIASEIKFRASICRIAKSTDSVLDMLSLRGELKDEESCNGEMKTDLKSLVDLCLKLKKEANLSRIRSRGLEKFADEMRLCFGIKSAKPIMIPDSPTKPIRKSSRHCQLVPFTSNVSKYIMICRYSWGKKASTKFLKIFKEPMKSTLACTAVTTTKSTETMITGIRFLEQRANSILKKGQTSYNHHQKSYDRRN